MLNFWPYAARLQAAGMRTVIGVDGMMRQLGLSADVPAVGFVFHEGWAKANPAALGGFVAASREAKAIMARSDAEWDRLRPLMKAEDEATWAALRDQFRAGIPRRWTAEEREAAAKLYGLMAKLGGRDLVGGAMTLPDGTFWPGVHF